MNDEQNEDAFKQTTNAMQLSDQGDAKEREKLSCS